MDSEERLTRAIAKAAYEQALETGYPSFFDDRIDALAKEVGATPQQARQVQREMVDGYLLTENSPGFFNATPLLLLRYEESDREAAYRLNEARRWMLEGVGRFEDEKPGASVTFQPDESDPFTEKELFLAANTLAYLGLLEMPDRALPAIFSVKLATRGYDALRDAELLRRTLPISVTDDEQAQIVVAPDALREVITSCEQMLESSGWRQALVELGRGDNEFRDRKWVGAVREYYAALESGLKYALGISAEDASEGGRALRRLARRAVAEGVIPPNYQALFDYADSIRSPRSHGGGPRAEAAGEIEVGQAEALLMGNHTRALLLYLGQRGSAIAKRKGDAAEAR